MYPAQIALTILMTMYELQMTERRALEWSAFLPHILETTSSNFSPESSYPNVLSVSRPLKIGRDHYI
jgi:hypothetical protein